MDNDKALDWTGAYLDWMEDRDGPRDDVAALAAAQAVDRVDFTARFLEWMETPPRLDRRASDKGGVAVMGEVRVDEQDLRRESVLLDALHMEAECVHILRQILDRGSSSPDALGMALETLRNANELLADESRAWHALRAQKRWHIALSPRSAWENQLDYHWTEALDNVAADVQSLTGRVLRLSELNG
jgi:hypothetical protein